MADSESETPNSYSRLIVTSALSRLVWEMFEYDTETDRHTDGQTTRTITIAGPHIVREYNRFSL